MMCRKEEPLLSSEIEESRSKQRTAFEGERSLHHRGGAGHRLDLRVRRERAQVEEPHGGSGSGLRQGLDPAVPGRAVPQSKRGVARKNDAERSLERFR